MVDALEDISYAVAEGFVALEFEFCHDSVGNKT